MVHLATFTFSMVATIVQLRAHGLHIAINEFSYARTVQHIIDHVCEVNKCNNNICQRRYYVSQSSIWMKCLK